MKKIIVLALLILLPCSLMAQINLGNRIKNKLNQRVNQKVDKAVDDALDTAEGKEKPNQASSPEETTATESGKPPTKAEAKKARLNSFSKFDFVQGEKVIFYDDFQKSRLGEFPDYWLTNGMGQTVKLEAYPGQWLQLSKNSLYAPDKKFNFPQDYTIEFDLIMLGPEQHSLGALNIRLVHIDKEGVNPMAAYTPENTRAGLHLNWNNSSFNIHDNATNINNSYSNPVLYAKRGSPVHIAIAVNGTRYRLWADEQKIFDIPQLIQKGSKRNYVFLESHLNKEDPDYQLYISNFRVAEGKPDLRKALAAEGKFVTRGISFDTGSDELQPASYGIIREIAQVLQEDPGLRIRIVGHTDSDGNAQGNLELSRRRAQAIKAALVDTYKIEEKRLETDGKGAGEPLDNNNTSEGKANNRRAEFIRL